MLDIFIIGLILLAVIIFALGKSFTDWGLLLLAGSLFFIVGGLMLTSGWETFNQGEFIIQDVNSTIPGCSSDNANCILVEPVLITYPADLGTNPEVYGFAIALLALGFVIGLNGMSVKSDASAAEKASED